MALSANTVFEVRTDGSDTNGGGFVAGATGTDYSLIATARPNGGTDGSSVLAAATGNTTINCSDAQFSAAIVGNIVYFAGGTGSLTGVRREVKTRVSATQITVDANVAASTGMTMNIGGAILSPSVAAATALVSGQLIYVKYAATPYSITATTAGVGGPISLSQNVKMIGYDTTRTVSNTDANRPMIQMATGANVIANVFAMASTGTEARNLILDGGTATGYQVGFNPVAATRVIRCRVQNWAYGYGWSGAGIWILCTATGCGLTAFRGTSTAYCVACEAFGNTTVPFSVNVALFCKSYSNTGATADGFTANGLVAQCVAYNNDRDGFGLNAVSLLIGCIAEQNKGYGIADRSSTNLTALVVDCVTSGVNTSGSSHFAVNPCNTITDLAGVSAFVDAAQLDFRPILALRGQSLTLNALLNTIGAGHLDIGAVQHLDPGGVVIIED